MSVGSGTSAEGTGGGTVHSTCGGGGSAPTPTGSSGEAVGGGSEPSSNETPLVNTCSRSSSSPRSSDSLVLSSPADELVLELDGEVVVVRPETFGPCLRRTKAPKHSLQCLCLLELM